ncbi:hypothetical protein BASA60_006383 [Batrachochytrium salamandrivorans]|nr:hypothetical protein BASA60_006383 [Batrachochytrium salamandrivorans]
MVSHCMPQILKFGSIPLDDPNCPPPASLVHEKLVLNGPEHASFSIEQSHHDDLESSDGVVTTHCQTIIRQQIQWAAHIGLVFVRVPLYISEMRMMDGHAGIQSRMLSRHNTKLLVTDCQVVISSPSGESLHRAGTLSYIASILNTYIDRCQQEISCSNLAAGYHEIVESAELVILRIEYAIPTLSVDTFHIIIIGGYQALVDRVPSARILSRKQFFKDIGGV